MANMSVRAAVRRQAPYRFSHHPQRVKLDQNESPVDLPDEVRAAVLERLAVVAFNRYPGVHAVQLEERLAARHGWDPAGVVTANGSNSLVFALALIAALGRSLITVKPSFQLYRSQAALVDAELVEVPLGPAFALPVAELSEAVAARAGLLLLANPAAPTGNRFADDDVHAVLAAGTGQTLSVIDEAYCDFSGADQAHLVRARSDAVSLRTLSKACGLAGARIGYALTTPELADDLRKALPPFSVSDVQVAIALTLLDHPEVIAANVQQATAERSRLLAEMRALGVEAFDSSANFVLFRTADPATLHARLLAEDIVVRRQDHLPGAEGCLRVSVGTAAENDAFLAALRAALGSLRS